MRAVKVYGPSEQVYEDRIAALEAMLVCYRVGKRPTERLHQRLEATKIALHTLRTIRR